MSLSEVIRMIPRLTDLARFKMKLSPAELGHGETPLPRHRILLSLMVDLAVVAALSGLLSGLFGEALRSFFTTPGLQKIFSGMRFNLLSLFTLSVVAVSYFHLSYFLNDGQTYGGHLLGLRRNLRAHSNSEAFTHALETLAVYLSFGLSVHAFAAKTHRHDHRYRELIGFREMPAPDLLGVLEPSASREEMPLRTAA